MYDIRIFFLSLSDIKYLVNVKCWFVSCFSFWNIRDMQCAACCRRLTRIISDGGAGGWSLHVVRYLTVYVVIEICTLFTRPDLAH